MATALQKISEQATHKDDRAFVGRAAAGLATRVLVTQVGVIKRGDSTQALRGIARRHCLHELCFTRHAVRYGTPQVAAQLQGGHAVVRGSLVPAQARDHRVDHPLAGSE